MSFDGFDEAFLTAEEFPNLHRLREVAEGRSFDDVLAGLAWVRPPHEIVLQEMSQLLDTHRKFEATLPLCTALAKVETTPVGRFIFIANAGYCQQNLGAYAEAEEFFDAAWDALAPVEDADQHRGWLCNQRAWNFYLCGDPGPGVEWAEKAIEYNPENWPAHATLGSLLYEVGDDRAFESFAVAMEHGIDPEPSPELADDERYRELAEIHEIALPEG